MIDQWSFTSPFEGVVPHLYLDSEGLPTAGVGFLIPTADDLRQYAWSPNVQEAQADYLLIKELPKGHTPAFYRKVCRARLSEDHMREVFDRKVAEFRRAMGAWKLERQPVEVQVALVDIAYNIGVDGLARYKQLKVAIDTRDWKSAADECHRRDTANSPGLAKRNAATRDLFLALL